MPINSDIQKLAGRLPDSIFREVPGILSKFNIDGPKRLSHLLGQCHHETGGWKYYTENLNYTTIEQVIKIFRSDVDTDDDRVIEPHEIEHAKQYLRNPEKLANFVYANQNGNGDELSGDGWRFRGRGPLHTTGRSNYKSLGDYLGVDLITNPELVATKYLLSSAAFFFMNNKLWPICDKGIDISTITAVSKKVNGGTHGLENRIEYTQKYYNILTI